jgi:hypothetical protein
MGAIVERGNADLYDPALAEANQNVGERRQRQWCHRANGNGNNAGS